LPLYFGKAAVCLIQSFKQSRAKSALFQFIRCQSSPHSIKTGAPIAMYELGPRIAVGKGCEFRRLRAVKPNALPGK